VVTFSLSALACVEASGEGVRELRGSNRDVQHFFLLAIALRCQHCGLSCIAKYLIRAAEDARCFRTMVTSCLM
jgi:hypothetical protein